MISRDNKDGGVTEMGKKLDFIKLYEEIYKCLPSRDIQKLLDVCYGIIGVPILVVDILYNVLGNAPNELTGDALWDHLITHRGFDTEHIASLYEDGIIQTVDNQKAPYVVDWGSSKENPKIQGIIKVNDIVEGYVTMCCTREEITPERMKAMDIIMNICSYFFVRNDSESSMDHTYQRAFVSELFNNRIKTEKQLQTWFYNMQQELLPPFQISAISTVTEHEKNVLSYMRKALQELSKYQVLLIQNNMLYILRYQYKEDQKINSEENVATILEIFGSQCGVSNAFDNLLDAAIYQKQAEDALDIGRKLNKEASIYHYNKYCTPAILLPRVKELAKVSFVPQVIQEIEDYDQENGTELLLTLKSYVNNMLNTAITAKELHIHRNSLLYRIGRIEELFQLSLKNSETFRTLMIAFYMMELAEQIYND